ncbi:transporter substrate-binding domain-containing protein [Sporosarcina sp. HYO08]|uniref:transporter substrate-binding domain-containing protein n=1 Tax=Sporosarcina sp. HYO08 TaxID=1759557 RepID=UPI00079A14EF|nr:transporter substrate-binding domain-containing protein [Sporosarcina sp. HYO08]KXH83891.1 ABC transporter substrate-binding protein [Sporosarcina sp. HYO08]
MKRALLFLLMSLILVLSACSDASSGSGGGEEAGPSTIDKVLKNKKLVVGTAPGYFPFEMKDKKGEFIGYDIDVARAIAEALGVEIEFKQFGFDGLIPALNTGEIDIILAGMTIRGDRALAVSFANPYFSTGQVLMLPKGDTTTKSWEDLDKPGKKIAVSLGTTGALLAKQLFKEATVQDFDDFPSAGMALTQGQADGVVYDEPAIRTFEQMHEESVKGVYDLISVEELGIAVKYNDLRTVQWLNSFLASYKGSPKELESFDKWFTNIDWMDDVEPKE